MVTGEVIPASSDNAPHASSSASSGRLTAILVPSLLGGVVLLLLLSYLLYRRRNASVERAKGESLVSWRPRGSAELIFADRAEDEESTPAYPLHPLHHTPSPPSPTEEAPPPLYSREPSDEVLSVREGEAPAPRSSQGVEGEVLGEPRMLVAAHF
ncbi:hypothetical protein BCR35DRAFT_310612, partial [Leucosporidium creatinivorum]